MNTNENAQSVIKPLVLFGAASCAGAQDTRCDMGPETVRASNLLLSLKQNGIDAHWQDIFRPVGRHSDIDAILDVCSNLEKEIRKTVNEGKKFTVIGGDHSCAIGTWSGAANATAPASTGLIWVDAHMDSHTPDTSPSGAYHGMPLACLLGHGEPELCKIGSQEVKLNPRHVCLVGVRSYESAEHALLDKLGVKVFFTDEIKKRGLNSVMDQAISIVQGAQGFGVSIDLDCIDPVDAPGVGSPSQGGLQAETLLKELPLLKQHDKFLGAEITELNPFRDVNNKTVDLVCDLVQAMA